MFELDMLPAEDGDCFILSYGDCGQLNHVVVDCGRTGTYALLRRKLSAIRRECGRFRLLVLTHLDDDHIAGAMQLVQDPDLPIEPENVWFNGRIDGTALQTLGFSKAEKLLEGLSARGWPVNVATSGAPLALCGERPLDLSLDGGLKLTVLSPTLASVETLRRHWEIWARPKAELDGAPQAAAAKSGLQELGQRRSAPPQIVDVPRLAESAEDLDVGYVNASSIAFVAEWNGRRVLMSGDASAQQIEASLRRLAAGQERYRLDLMTVPHHGSAKNMSRSLAELVDCRSFAISSDGKSGRPDPESLARLLHFGAPRQPVFHFNYRHAFAEIWDRLALQRSHDLVCRYPPEPHMGIAVSI